MNVKLGLVPLSLVIGLIPASAGAAERTFTLTSVDRIQVEGPYLVEVRTGRGSSAKAIGDRDAIDALRMDVIGQTLTISTDRTNWKGTRSNETSGPVIIRLTTGELRRAALSGTGSLAIDRLRGPHVQLSVQGSGRINVGSITADRLDVTATGSGGMRLSGTAKATNVTLRGSAAIDAAAFTANDLVLVNQGSGDIAIGAKGTARITAAGAGRTVVKGTRACTVRAPGAGTVTCGP